MTRSLPPIAPNPFLQRAVLPPVVQVARAPMAGGPQHFVPPLPAGPPALLLDLGLTCAAMGATPRALAALRAAVALRPRYAPAWRKLAELLAASGDFAGAAAARQAAEAGDEPHPQAAISPGKLAKGEQALVAMLRGAPHLSPAGLLRGHLLHHPRDAAALRILAEYIFLEREPDTAEALLQRAVELAPDYRGAREDLVRLLAARARWIPAEPHVAALLKADPKHEYYRLMDAELRNALGDAAAAVLRYEAILAAGKPREPRIWLSYGHALRDGGRRAEAVAAYHNAIAAVPEAGESYYSITNLKVGKPAPEFIAAMRAQLAEQKGSILDRVFLHFGLGQALEQTGAYGESFAQYAAGARLRLENPAQYEVNYGADVLARRVAENRAFFSAPRLAVQAAARFDTVPIFIIGMPRSGSTLLEQILASHPEVEATQELPELPNVILDLAACTGDYPGCLDAMRPDALAELGRDYIAAVRKWRQTDRRYVVDKMLGNWMQIGFIHKVLPQAKIIDTRRHPMAACFGTFKQLIIGGENYTYSLTDIARRYRGYVELVAHYEALLPGRVHRVIYEDMVEDSERHIRALLEYCGLPFDPACLRFWETARSIRTPSSEQVRQPIYRAGLEQWRNFEPWLDELRQALGDLPQTYRHFVPHAQQWERPMQPPDKAATLAASLAQSLALPLLTPAGSVSLMDALRAAAALQAPTQAPEDIGVLVARGLTCAVLRLDDLALECLSDAARQGPIPASAWRALALLRRRHGDRARAEVATARAETAGAVTPLPPQLPRQRVQAEKTLRIMLRRAAPEHPESVLRGHLVANPCDAAALYLMAGLAVAGGGEVQAEKLLARVLELAPDYAAARQDYAAVLLRLGKGARMLPHLDLLLAARPADIELLRMRATSLELLGDNAGAVAALEKMQTTQKAQGSARESVFWISYGRCLQSAGRVADSVRAFRTAIARRPQFGEAYWGIANLKSELLTADDIAAIRRHLANPATPAEDRVHFQYALGFALEQAREYAESFTHYEQGAALRGAELRAAGKAYDADDMARQTNRHRAYFTAARLARPAAAAPLPATPIFVLGMPRSGSTLVEQILSSHSLIEGTQELPEIAHIARALGDADIDPAGFPTCLDRFTPAGLAALGQEYLRRAARYRTTARPYFIDKMPANWTNIGLIHLVLPQARIIDTRRDAMGCCFSGFKQLIAKGAEYSCDLASLGHFYTQYESLVAHYDAAMPGRIHRVTYETMVADTEGEIARLLAYCGVKFEASCLRFWETRRAVATPSAEQVRRPIFRDAVEQWRHYEPWLAPLRAALSG